MAKYHSVDLEELKKNVELRPDGTLLWKTGGRGTKRRPGFPAFATATSNGYLQGSFQGTKLMTHRVVWAMHHGEWPDGWIDHINGCRDDNRPENLRIAPIGLSNHNRRYKSAECGYIGVTRSKICATPRYISQIQHKGKHYYLGMYKTPKEAAQVRDKKAVELYGADALLNFPNTE